MIRPIMMFVVAAMVPVAVHAADLRHQTILGAYSGLAGDAPSAARGEALFRGSFGGGDPRTPSCTSCHTADPRQMGRNAKTGRSIDPLAISVNPDRFVERDQVDKHFVRDCKSVLGRECLPQEKADFTLFMLEK